MFGLTTASVSTGVCALRECRAWPKCGETHKVKKMGETETPVPDLIHLESVQDLSNLSMQINL